MSCFSYFGGGFDAKKEPKKNGAKEGASMAAGSNRGNVMKKTENSKQKNSTESTTKEASSGNIAAQTFTFRELAAATKNFRPDCLLGEGGFGRVYKGCLENSGQFVAVKQLDRNGLQGNREFLVEVLMLSLLHHQNLVNLIGYCADGDQRLLVYEFMPLGSLEDHLLDLSTDKKPLSWYTRMKIAFGAAQGLEYLHDKANPPVIYRDLKTSSILLDEGLNPKLSDFGLAKLGPMGDKVPVTSRVMGTYGYSAPEYAAGGNLTLKSDVYSFGVVLLELITGRRAMDTTKPTNEQNLVAWAQPMFRDQKRFPELVDPLLQGDFPAKGLNQAVAVAAMCLQEEASVRPLMADVVVTLSFLVDALPISQGSATPPSVHSSLPEERAQGDKAKSSDSGSTGDREHQLGSNSRRRQGSRHGSGYSSRRSSRHGSGGSSSRRSSRHGSDGGSSLKHSKRSSRRGSDGSLSSKHSHGSSRHGSDDSGSEKYQGSPHGSGGSVSNQGSQHGSGGSSSRYSEGFEDESDLM